MQSYVISGINFDKDRDVATVQPAEVIDAAKIVLSDKAGTNVTERISNKCQAQAAVLSIYRRSGGEEMCFSFPVPPKPSLMQRIRGRFVQIRDRLTQIWIWNVCYKARMWIHMRFHRDTELPSGTQALRAMIRSGFSKEGITLADLPYPPEPTAVEWAISDEKRKF